MLTSFRPMMLSRAGGPLSRSDAAMIFLFPLEEARHVHCAVERPSITAALLAHVIRDAIGRGVPVFDFLRGEEPYKYAFGPAPQNLWRVRVAP